MKAIPKVAIFLDISKGFERQLFSGVLRFNNKVPWNIYRPDPVLWGRSEVGDVIKLIKQWGPDGIIVVGKPEKIEPVVSLGLPTAVAPAQKATSSNKMISIKADNYRIGKLAAEHLLLKGYQHFAFSGFASVSCCPARCQGFCDTVEQAGYFVDVYNPPKSKSLNQWQNEQTIVIDWLSSLEKPIGLFACTDKRNQQISQACVLAGIHVPDQIALIGVDNDEMICNMSNPKLSSISLNAENAGYHAAEKLQQLMEGHAVEQKVPVIPRGVITRTSTDIFFSKDLEVVKVLDFIRKNALKPIDVSDVVEQTTLSRRVLYNRFKKVVGRGISAELKRLRIEKIEDLLLNTNMSVSEIAHFLGDEIVNPEHIGRYFKSAKGICPSEYRRIHGKSEII